MLAFLLVTLSCFSVMFARSVTVLGRVVAFLAWLTLSALFLTATYGTVQPPSRAVRPDVCDWCRDHYFQCVE